nr:PREDICTED: endomucin isoform X1 [Struthio camelus australis]
MTTASTGDQCKQIIGYPGKLLDPRAILPPRKENTVEEQAERGCRNSSVRSRRIVEEGMNLTAMDLHPVHVAGISKDTRLTSLNSLTYLGHAIYHKQSPTSWCTITLVQTGSLQGFSLVTTQLHRLGVDLLESSSAEKDLGVLKSCTIIMDENNPTTKASCTTLTSISAEKTSASPVTTLQSPVPTTTAREVRNESITSSATLSSTNATQQTTQGTTPQPPVKTSPAAEDKSNSTTNTTQAYETQSAQNGSLGASSTKGPSLPPTTALQKTTFAPETSSLLVSSTADPASFGSSEKSSENKKLPEDTIHYSSVILPIVITLIVITLSVFSLVALYRMCQKKTPERQENGTEQAQSDKEGVKLLSVKTSSAETVFVEVRDLYEVGFSLPSANLYELTTPTPTGEVSQGRTTGEHSSQGKNKTQQRDDSSSHVSSKYM